jgi:glucose-1-phosphate thymidylyltransferase
MKVIIPAAGIGTRLRPHTYTLPKALLYVAGRPIISHIIDEVKKLTISGVVLIIGYKGDLIEEYVKHEYPDLAVDFVVQQERKGIGHAIDLTRNLADTGEPLLVILGDTIIRTDLKRITESNNNALGVKKVDDPRRFGVAEVRDGAIVRLIEKPEKPTSNLAIVGLYYVKDSSLLFQLLKEQIARNILTRGEFQITDTLQMMIEKGSRFVPFEIDEWYDCGKADALLETNRTLLENAPECAPIAGSIIRRPAHIAPSARIVNSIIGPYVSIASNSVVENSIIRDSVVDQAAHVTDCLLESSIVGSQAVIQGVFQQLNVGDSSEVVFK